MHWTPHWPNMVKRVRKHRKHTLRRSTSSLTRTPTGNPSSSAFVITDRMCTISSSVNASRSLTPVTTAAAAAAAADDDLLNGIDDDEAAAAAAAAGKSSIGSSSSSYLVHSSSAAAFMAFNGFSGFMVAVVEISDCRESGRDVGGDEHADESRLLL